MAVGLRLECVDALLADDPLAAKIYALVLQGYSGPEIERALGISERERDTAWRRAERILRRALPDDLADAPLPHRSE